MDMHIEAAKYAFVWVYMHVHIQEYSLGRASSNLNKLAVHVTASPLGKCTGVRGRDASIHGLVDVMIDWYDLTLYC